MRSVWSRVGPGVSIDGLAGGAQPGKGGGSEQLRARNRKVMGDGRERRLSHHRQRRVAIGGRHLRTGRPKQGRDALHRPGAQRLVAVERRPQREAGHDAREQAHGGARVAAVERPRREMARPVIT